MIRITKGNLAKPLGILANIEKKLELLPLTKSFFSEVCESTEEYQVRRCKWAINQFIRANNEIKLWKVQRIAGIRKDSFEKIRQDIISYLNNIKEKGC